MISVAMVIDTKDTSFWNFLICFSILVFLRGQNFYPSILLVSFSTKNAESDNHNRICL